MRHVVLRIRVTYQVEISIARLHADRTKQLCERLKLLQTKPSLVFNRANEPHAKPYNLTTYIEKKTTCLITCISKIC